MSPVYPNIQCGVASLITPLVTNENSFNPCFISNFILILSVLHFAYGTYKVYTVSKSPQYGNSSRKSTGLIHCVRVSLVALQLFLVVYLISFLSIHERFADSKIVSFGALALTLAVVILPFHFIEVSHNPTASDLLVSFWLLLTTVEVVLIYQDTYTNWVIFKSVEYPNRVFVSELLLVLTAPIIFVLELSYWKPSHELTFEYVSHGREAELAKPHLVDRLTFSWMNELIMKSYHSQTVDQFDLPETAVKLSADVATSTLLKNWNHQVENNTVGEISSSTKESPSKPSLTVPLFKSFGLMLILSFLLEISSDSLSFVEPQLLRIFIRFFDDENPVALKGILISLSMFVAMLFQTFLYNSFTLVNLEVGLNVRSSLCTIIYRKSLKLSSAARSKASTGDIINLVSVDVNRIQSIIMDISILVIAPFDVIVCIVSLWPLLGKSTLAGVAVMLFLIPLNSALVKYIRRFNKVQMKLKDARTRITNEILMCIKSIKLFNWENAMLEKLSVARNEKELANQRKISAFNQGVGLIWYAIPFLVTFSFFSTFALTGKIPLTSDIVFPAVSLLNLLSNPLVQLPNFINQMVEASVSMNRIRDFLLLEEIDDKVVHLLEKAKAPGDVGVKLENVNFLWGKKNEDKDASENQYALRSVNFTARKGQLSCVVGRVGSGKSSLLYGILGQLVIENSTVSKPETPAIAKLDTSGTISNNSDTTGDAESVEQSLGQGVPTIEIHGSVAYCSQQPWIMNASVKENVLFGHRFDKEFYDKTVEACQLLPDIEILPDRDDTQVGEKGVSLSGGQKARLALARAVYSRSDIYLLDDVLSAVDSHVGKNIIDRILSSEGLLSSKTIILCTNSISVLKYSSQVSLIQKGRIVEESSYEDINLENHPDLYNLLDEFDRENSENTSPEESDNETGVNQQDATSELVDSHADEVLEFVGEEVSESSAKPSQQVNLSSNRSLRRASVETFRWEPLKRLLPTLRSGQSNETVQKGKVKWSIYLAYIKACSYSGVFVWSIVMIITALVDVWSNYWLKSWTESNSRSGNNDSVWEYITVYAALGVSTTILSVARNSIVSIFLSYNASVKIHNDMAQRIIRAPMSYFEKTPVGRIMNRFTSDIQKIDSSISSMIAFFIRILFATIVTFVVIGIVIPFYVVVITFLSALYVYYEIFYVAISRELKRLVSISRSPIYAHIGESLNGLETIRAFRQSDRFGFINSSNLDFNLKSVYVLRSINRWLHFRLQFIGAFGIFTASSLAIYTLWTDNALSSSMAGFIMTYALQVTGALKILVRYSAEVETDIVAVERCLEYTTLPVEEDEEQLARMSKPPISWPMDGGIKFHEYSTRYRENLDLILKNITFEIKAGQKIGVVGRTGAGKSSLALAIFRIIEAAEGNISIDGLNTSGMSLGDLRSKLGIIPQDSQLIEGTIRYNLDPFDYFTDEEVWRALEVSHLKEHILTLVHEDEVAEDGEIKDANLQPKTRTQLDCLVKEGGSNFSSGQRQLMSLARVLLRMKNSKILILDEATAAVDVQTDKFIQETIRSELKDKTIITIAHRLETVMDSDVIATLDHGELKEFDSPENLLKDKSGIFYSLCSQGGYI